MKRTLLAAMLLVACGGQDMPGGDSDRPPTEGEVCDFFGAHFCPRLVVCAGGTLYDCQANFKKGCCLDNGVCARPSKGGGGAVFEDYQRACGPALDAQTCSAILAQPWVPPAACK